MTATFSFPVLPSNDIVSILKEAEIAIIREEDLINPKSAFIIAIYTNILICLDPLQEDHDQADFTALGLLENPDLHVDAIRIMNLCNKIKEFVACVSCPIVFTLKDLIRPDTNRTAVFLSCILNFCLHKDTILESLQPYVAEVIDREGRRAELESRISELNMEISILKEAREREHQQPFIQEIDGKVKELWQTIHGLHKHQMSSKASLMSLREKAIAIDEKISSADSQLVQSAQENANLRSKIVQSPDKLQGTLEEKKLVRDEMKNSDRSAMQAFQEKTAILEVYSKALKSMSKHFAKMQAIQEQRSFEICEVPTTVNKDVKVLKSKLSDEGVLYRSLEAKLVEWQGKVEQVHESIKAYEKERDMNRKEVNTAMDHFKLAVKSNKHNLNMRINSARESQSALEQQLRLKCEEIVTEFCNCSHSVRTCIQRLEEGIATKKRRLEEGV